MLKLLASAFGLAAWSTGLGLLFFTLLAQVGEASQPAGNEPTLSVYPTILGADMSFPGLAHVTLDTGKGSGGDDVVFNAAGAYLYRSVVDHGDGTYTTQVGALSQPGGATLTATINGVEIPDSVELTFVESEIGPADALASEVSTNLGTRYLVAADPSEEVDISVIVRDALGQMRFEDTDTVELSATHGELSDVWFDYGAYVYSATLSGIAGPAEVVVSATVNGQLIPRTVTVVFSDQPIPTHNIEVTLLNDPDEMYADGQTIAEFEVAFFNEDQQPFGSGGHRVEVLATFAYDARLGSTVIDHGDGTYTARLVAPTQPNHAMMLRFWSEFTGIYTMWSQDFWFQSENVFEDRFELADD